MTTLTGQIRCEDHRDLGSVERSEGLEAQLSDASMFVKGPPEDSSSHRKQSVSAYHKEHLRLELLSGRPAVGVGL
jgi:hypothetical protein